MRIAHVKISNILGIEELEFDAGKFNEITGRNGLGKTSVVEAIRGLIKGGEDATLLRKGAKVGQVVVVMDNGMELKSRVTEKGTTRTIKQNGANVDRPAEVLKAVVDMFSVNPVDFLRAPAKQRVNVLLESLPMKAESARLAEIVGHDVQPNPKLHALEQIQAVRTEIFDDRTGTNRAVKEKESTINQLTETLPDGEVEVPAGADDLVATLAAIDGQKQAELDRIATKLASFRAESEGRKQAIREEIGLAIGELENERAEIDAKIAQKKTERAERESAETSAFAEVGQKASGQREKKLTEFAARREAVSSRLAEIQAAQSQAARYSATRETIKTMRTEARSLQEDADRQTKALNDLDAYKVELLGDLPIKGLEVIDGAIFRDGIAFDRLNTAQQTEIAVEIAKLRAGKLAVSCVDGIEHLDSEHYEAFREQAIASGLQLFVTRVSDGEFSVNSAN